jgi:putative membrane protein
MVNTHRNIMNENQSVLSQAQITPSDNAVSQQLRTDSQNEMSTLEGLRGRDFDREYLDDQIRDHNKAIELVDRIVPNIKNPQLKAHLQNARTRLEAHLRQAEKLQQKMQQGSTLKQPTEKTPSREEHEGGSHAPH